MIDPWKGLSVFYNISKIGIHPTVELKNNEFSLKTLQFETFMGNWVIMVKVLRNWHDPFNGMLRTSI